METALLALGALHLLLQTLLLLWIFLHRNVRILCWLTLKTKFNIMSIHSDMAFYIVTKFSFYSIFYHMQYCLVAACVQIPPQSSITTSCSIKIQRGALRLSDLLLQCSNDCDKPAMLTYSSGPWQSHYSLCLCNDLPQPGSTNSSGYIHLLTQAPYVKPPSIYIVDQSLKQVLPKMEEKLKGMPVCLHGGLRHHCSSRLVLFV